MTLEQFLFYLAATIAVVSTILALTRYNATHALIYLIISLLSSAIIFYLLGAPFAAVLEVVIYAGAIMVLFVFVVMMLNLGTPGIEQEMVWQKPRMWALPSLLTLILFFEIIYMLSTDTSNHSGNVINPGQVGEKLFGPYVLAVEIASMLLLAGLVGAYHLGRRYLAESRGTE